MNGSHVSVRPVELSDAAHVQENCFPMNTLEEVEARIRRNLDVLEQGLGIQLVAAVDEAVVGTVSLIRNTHPMLGHRAQLDDLIVHGDYRRRGIARRLHEESRAYAESMAVEILEVSCRAGTVAEQVYRRLGFVEYGRLPRGLIEPWGNRNVFDVVYLYQPIEQT